MSPSQVLLVQSKVSLSAFIALQEVLWRRWTWTRTGVANAEAGVHLRKKPEELLRKRSSVQRPGLSASNSAMSSATLAETVLVSMKGVPTCSHGICSTASNLNHLPHCLGFSESLINTIPNRKTVSRDDGRPCVDRYGVPKGSR